MAKDDDQIIEQIFALLRDQCNEPRLHKLIRNKFEIEKTLHKKEIDVIFKTKSNTLFVIEVKTHGKKADPLTKFKDAVKQLKDGQNHINQYNNVYQMYFKTFKKVRHSFVYYCKKTRGNDPKEGIYILKVEPSELRSKLNTFKKASDINSYVYFTQWKIFIRRAWNTVNRY